MVVIPKQPFLDWLHQADPTSGEITLAAVQDDPSILDECDSDQQIERRLRAACKEIFEDQLNGWYRAEELWPKDRSYRTFRHWFDCSIYSVLIDLAHAPLRAEEV